MQSAITFLVLKTSQGTLEQVHDAYLLDGMNNENGI